MTERYDPQQIEAKWQRVWEDERRLPRAEPRPRRGGGRAPLVPAGDAPVPVGVAAHGARPQLHDGRRPDAPAPAERLARAAPDGLRLVRPARRERRASSEGGHPARDHRALHRRHPRADEAAGLGDRLGPRGLGPRARVLPLDAVAVPAVLRARPRVPQGRAGQLVPERPDGRRERVRHRRPAASAAARQVEARNLEQWFFKITDYADELLEYDLPEGGDWPERTKTIQRNWIGRSEGAEILFRIDELDDGRARLHDAAGHAVRRDVLRAGARASARRAHRRTRRFRRTRSRPRPGAARSGRPRR